MTTTNEAEPQTDLVRKAAAAALADVDALAVSTDDRKIVLKALLKARLGGFTPTALGSTGVSHVGTGGGDGAQQAAVEGGDVMGKIAAALEIDRDSLELVYALQDGEPHVVVSSKKISNNKAVGTRQLGQLVAAARQIVGMEEWTSAATIRKVVTDYGRQDSSNFAATIQQMDNVAVVRGKGQKREVKITKPGIENTAELIKTLAGADS